MTENELALSSAAFIEQFAALARRLSSINVAVHAADLNWSFRCWTLTVLKRDEAVRFIYDGQDSYLTIEASPVSNDSYPSQWKKLLIKGINNTNGEAIAFLEDFVKKRFSI